MKKFISAICLLVVFAACSSEEKLIEYGPYEPSIDEITNTPHGGDYEKIVSGQAYISDWSTLEYFAKEDFTEVTSFIFQGAFTNDNPELADRMCLFPDLQKTRGDFRLEEVSVGSLEGFGQLKDIEGFLKVTKIRQLNDFSGFKSLSVIENGIYFDYLDSLQSFTGLHNAKLMGGIVYIRRCGKITDLNNLPQIDTSNPSENRITEFTLSQNDALLSLDGVESLTEVNGTVSIFKCYLLENIDGLRNLERIDGDLLIKTNPVLKNIDALRGLKEVTGDIVFESNKLQADWDVSFLPKEPIFL